MNVRAMLLVGVCLGLGAPVWAWGPLAHQAVTGHAIDTLPGGLKPFYKAHRLELPSLSLEEATEVTEEAPERRFAIDRFAPFPFTDVPRTEEALKARYPEIVPLAGRLPWLIQESYGRLVDAFKSGDKAKILTESDLLAGLVADLRNPLALTENADGQKTGQQGLWVRVTAKLGEGVAKRLKLSPDDAHLIEDPKNYPFAAISGTYIWLDNLLYFEELARRGKGGYSDIYYQEFEARGGNLLKDLLSHAAADTGSYWYTAWNAAGRPVFKP